MLGLPNIVIMWVMNDATVTKVTVTLYGPHFEKLPSIDRFPLYTLFKTKGLPNVSLSIVF